nr:hypothetical protein [Acetobacter pasteurianus]
MHAKSSPVRIMAATGGGCTQAARLAFTPLWWCAPHRRTHYIERVFSMDIQAIDQTYNQFQAQAQQSATALQTLCAKMQTAADGGDMQAREWLLDLKELALSLRDEQSQVINLLQALHTALATQVQQNVAPPQPSALSTVKPEVENVLNDVINSGFAHSLASGAGFGIGNTLINKLF